MAVSGDRLWVIALTGVILVCVGSSLGSLMLTMETYDDKNFCGNLKCRMTDSFDEGIFFITSISLYNMNRSDIRFQIATVHNDGNGIKINQSKISEVIGAGCINRYDADLSVNLMNLHDCQLGVFICELEYIDINGQRDTIITNVKADNVSDDLNYGALSSQLSKLSRRLDNTTKQLNMLRTNYTVELLALRQNYTVELVSLRNQNFILYTQFQNVSQELTLLKDQHSSVQKTLDAILKTNSEQSKNLPVLTSECVQGMPHDCPRVKFLLWGEIPALCDTETDGGGWIIIQRRTKGDVDFYKNWHSYKTGFGTPETDFWLGNDIIHNLTSKGYYQLRVDITHSGRKYFAVYTDFSVDNEQQNYRLTVSGYGGDAGDSLSYHNNMMFSTYDRDNDKNPSNCAVDLHGAWWYNNCRYSSLNGAWGVNSSSRIYWHHLNTDAVYTVTDIKVRLYQ